MGRTQSLGLFTASALRAIVAGTAAFVQTEKVQAGRVPVGDVKAGIALLVQSYYGSIEQKPLTAIAIGIYLHCARMLLSSCPT